jgi:hypothetical protein
MGFSSKQMHACDLSLLAFLHIIMNHNGWTRNIGLITGGILVFDYIFVKGFIFC